jgi:hypothetical protein
VKLWAPKVVGVLIVGIPRPHLGVPGKNAIWMWPPWRDAENIIRGEDGGFPQVRAMVNLVSLRLPMARPSTKSAQIVH